MKYKGRTGKGYYKEYFTIPKWFTKQFGSCGNGSLLNSLGSKCYIGNGMDGRTKNWRYGSFIKDCVYFREHIKQADFIIHFENSV